MEWLGEIPAHWEVKRLKDTVTTCQNGIWGAEPNGGGDDIACIRVADFDRTRNRVIDNELTMRSISPTEQKGRLLQRNDLLLEKSGGGVQQLVGTVVLYTLEHQAVCSNFVARMSVAHGNDSNYLCYLHAALYDGHLNIRSIKQTTGIQNLDSNAYLNEKVGLPRLEEQHVIAAFLDCETAKIDALVAKKERQIELLQEKRTAIISQAVIKGLDPTVPLKDANVQWIDKIPVHWSVKRISKAVQKITNGYVGPTRDILVDDGVKYLQSLHIKNGGIRFKTPYYVTNEWSQVHQRSILREGDVLIVQTGDIGQCCAVTKEYEGSNCHALIILRLKDGLGSGFYLSAFLRSDYGRNILLQTQTGALHPHLESGKVRDLFIVLPPSEEQERIMRFLDVETARIDSLAVKVRQHIDKLHEYRTALISAAVTGKIDVRGEAS